MDILVIAYDVTSLSDDEICQLEMEAVVQAEDSDGHPGVPVIASKTFRGDPDFAEHGSRVFTMAVE